MIEVYWLEQSEADIPNESDWLSSSELILLTAMRFAKRRADWRLGRWTAKCAVALLLNASLDRQSLADIAILPAPTGAPEVFVAGAPASVSLSLSHRDGVAACVVTRGDAALGCDMEIAEPRIDGFLTDYFTAEEQAIVSQVSNTDRWWLLGLLWAGKESALKALHEGLRLPTQCVVVTPDDGPILRAGDEKVYPADVVASLKSKSGSNRWSRLTVRYNQSRTFQGWWQRSGNLVRTVVADPPPAEPILFQLEGKYAVETLDGDQGIHRQARGTDGCLRVRTN